MAAAVSDFMGKALFSERASYTNLAIQCHICKAMVWMLCNLWQQDAASNAPICVMCYTRTPSRPQGLAISMLSIMSYLKMAPRHKE